MMQLFHFKAVNKLGNVIEESIEAESKDEVITVIQHRGLIPVSIRTNQASFFKRLLQTGKEQKKISIKGKELMFFCHELGILLNAGMPLDKALLAVSEIVNGSEKVSWVENIIDAVKGGASLSLSIQQSSVELPSYILGLIKIGEASGELGVILLRISDFIEKSEDLKDSVRSALVYPCVLLAIAFLSLIVLVIFVVPQFAELFADAGKSLPLPTQVVVRVGEFLASFWWLLCFIFAGFLSVCKKVLAKPRIRLRWDSLCLKLWLAGDLLTKIEVARFSRTMASLTESGVPLLKSLRLTKDALVNTKFIDEIDRISNELETGNRMVVSLSKTEVFPKLAVHMIGIGEDSGRLVEMLSSISNTYEKEVRKAIDRMLALLEPIMILGLGVIVSGIIMSILIAILDINELVM